MGLRSLAQSTIRGCAYLGGFAVVAFVIPGLMMDQAPQRVRPDWAAIERAQPRYQIAMQELSGFDANRSIRQHVYGGGRLDTFTWRMRAAADRHLSVEVYWRGGERVEFGEPADEFATRARTLGATEPVRAVGELETKFGAVSLFAFDTRDAGSECLGFIRSFPGERLQISGVSCLRSSPEDDRHVISHALDRLVLASTDVRQPTALLFAHAELERARCAPAAPLVADKRPPGWLADKNAPSLRGAAADIDSLRPAVPPRDTPAAHPHQL